MGRRRSRDSEPGWELPGAGLALHHTVKVGLLRLSDHTEVVEVDPPSRIVLEAKARPLGTARISIELRESDGGTNVLMEERPADRLTALVTENPVADLALRLRTPRH